MRKSLLFLFIVFIMIASSPAIAQPRGDTKILLPLALEESIRGAFGSQWITRVSVLNHGPEPVSLEGYFITECSIPCGFQPTPPGITFYPVFHFDDVGRRQVEGAFLYTTRAHLRWIDVDVHIQDLSRQSLTWGTEIPAVPETEAFTENLVLGDIPIEPRFRSLLRVYDFDPDRRLNSQPKKIAYRIFRIRPDLRYPLDPEDTRRVVAADPLIASGELTFVVAQLGLPNYPGYTRLDLSSIPALQNQERIRIELTPITQGLRYWAFVAVTNNETQHVTTVTP